MSAALPKRAVRPSLAVALALLALIASDWALRRVEKVDEQILAGQTGLSWVDEVLAQRAANQLQSQQLLDEVATAPTPRARVAARYKVVAQEVKLDRADSRLAMRMLRGVVEDGGLIPETLDARRQLISQAIADRDGKGAARMLGEYTDTVLLMPRGDAKLGRLLDTWKLGAEIFPDEPQMRLLERILHEFPLRGEAMAAYDTLERTARATGNAKVAAAAADMLAKTHAQLERQAAEIQLIQQLGGHIRGKDPAKAAQVLDALAPGLAPGVDYAMLYMQVIALHAEKGLEAEARRLLLKAGSSLDLDAIAEPHRGTLLASLALARIQAGPGAEAAVVLGRLPETKTLSPWRKHLAARLWLASPRAPSPLPVATLSSTATPPSASAGDSEAGWPDSWNAMSPDSKLAGAAEFPLTRWRAVSAGGSLHVQVDCAEPEPAKMLASKTRPDSAIWEDDSVEMFIAPRNDLLYHGLMFNSRGVRADMRVTASSPLLPPVYKEQWGWSSSARVAAEKTRTGWRLSISIPWKNLGISPADGACFFNLRRQRHAGGSRTPASWTEAGLTSQDPTSMGVLILK